MAPLRFRLTASSAPYTPTTRRGTWDNVTQASTSLMSPTPSGFASTRAQAVGSTTPNWDVVIRRFITEPVLTAGSLAGTVSWIISCGELDSLNTNAFTHMHIYVTAGDTDTVRGTLLADYIGDTEWTNTMTGYAEGPIALSSVNCQPGDRICAVFGYRASASATTQNGSLRHGGTGADLTEGQTGNTSNPGWIEFSGAEPLFTEAPPVPTPAEVLNIGSGVGQAHMKLQMARPGDGAFTTISLASLEAGFIEAPYFNTTADGLRVHMEARLDAPTTPGSSFSRCEFREVDASGADFSWNPISGEHVMEGITRLSALPPVKPEAVVAQIFDETGSADLCSIRTQLVSSSIRLRFRFLGTSVTSPQMASPYAVDTDFAWRLRVVNGVIEVYWTVGGTLVLPGSPQIVTAAVPSTVAYFKAGLYNGSNVAAGDAGTAIGAAEPRTLAIAHTIPDPALSAAFMTFFGGV